jgi:hypothetical protein
VNPYERMSEKQIQDCFATNIVTTDDDVSHALSRLADIARGEGCLILAVLLETLADEPADIAATRLPALRDLMTKEAFAIIPAAVTVLESVDSDFVMPKVRLEGVGHV